MDNKKKERTIFGCVMSVFLYPLSAHCRVANKLAFADGRLYKKFNKCLPGLFSSQSSGFMRGSFGELFVPLSTMGKGKEPPLSWINVTRKKVLNLGQALKNPSPVLEFLGAQ